MIIEPDFLHHWKTSMLVDELKDKAAPLYVIALWAHCQQRKTDRFSNLSAGALKAVCRFDGEATVLKSALETCGFIRGEGQDTVVHGWADVNAKLVSNWTNGGNGGRPPKTQPKPNDNPNGTQQEPTHNATETHTEPIEKIDKIEEREKIVSCAEPAPQASAPEPSILDFECVGPEKTWPLTAAKLAEWEEVYPHMDVMAALRRARVWCIDNPQKRKTAKGMTRFLGQWLATAQNKGENRKTGNFSKAVPMPDAAQMAHSSAQFESEESPIERLRRLTREEAMAAEQPTLI